MALFLVVCTVTCHIAYAACTNPLYTGVDSGCFRIVPNAGLSQSDAAAACASDGAQLASFQSAAEFVWATDYITANTPINSVLCVGLATMSAIMNRTAWSWSDGSSDEFLLSPDGQTWWLSGQPDRSGMCGLFWHSYYRTGLSDNDCSSTSYAGVSTGYICRMPQVTPCNPVVKYYAVPVSECDTDYDAFCKSSGHTHRFTHAFAARLLHTNAQQRRLKAARAQRSVH